MARKRKLKCPYSGADLVIEFESDTMKHTGWYIKGGVDLGLPFLSAESAEAACPERKCRYTGKDLILTKIDGKNLWVFVGEIVSMQKAYPSEQHARYYAGMRNGRSFEKKPVEIKVGEVRERVSDPFEDKRDSSVDAIVEEKVDKLLGGLKK